MSELTMQDGYDWSDEGIHPVSMSLEDELMAEQDEDAEFWADMAETAFPLDDVVEEEVEMTDTASIDHLFA